MIITALFSLFTTNVIFKEKIIKKTNGESENEF